MFYLIVIGLYLVFVVFAVKFSKTLGAGRWIRVLIAVGLLLLPFWNMILAKGIMWNFAAHNRPLQKVVRTVEKPESVTWLDNVWPGYNKHSRYWMVENYLDGEHLRQLILNGDDGLFYLYRAAAVDFKESEKLRTEYERLAREKKELEEKAKSAYREGKNNKELWRIVREEYEPKIKALGYQALRKSEIDQIFSKAEVFRSLKNLPQMNYQVVLEPVNLPSFSKKFIWCDEIRIHDNAKDENIAFSKRCLGYGFKYLPKPVSWPFYGGTRLGDEQVYSFDDKVLFGYADSKMGLDAVRAWKFGKNNK